MTNSSGDRDTKGEGGQGPLPPPLFMVHLSLPCPHSVYQFIGCHTIGSTALALVCVRGHFRVLKNEKFSTGEPLPHPPQLGRSAPSYVWPPTFKYVAVPMFRGVWNSGLSPLASSLKTDHCSRPPESLKSNSIPVTL